MRMHSDNGCLSLLSHVILQVTKMVRPLESPKSPKTDMTLVFCPFPVSPCFLFCARTKGKRIKINIVGRAALVVCVTSLDTGTILGKFA